MKIKLINQTHTKDGGSTTKAFTLIELLVVIAIIGILAAVVLASLNTARGKARDAKRLADLKNVQVALEMYYSENGAYPNTNGDWYGVCSTFGSKGFTGASGWVPSLAPTYMSVLPQDPKTIGGCSGYIYKTDIAGQYYVLLAYQSVEGVVPDSLKRISNPTESSYRISNHPTLDA